MQLKRYSDKAKKIVKSLAKHKDCLSDNNTLLACFRASLNKVRQVSRIRVPVISRMNLFKMAATELRRSLKGELFVNACVVKMRNQEQLIVLYM